jgi:predicted O-methyltransferase YrrM
MDVDLQKLLDELHHHGVEHDATKADRLDRLRNVEPDSAALLALLVQAIGVQRLLELGTSNGYSTVWLGDAVRSVGGTMVTVDLDPGRSSMAAENLERAGLTQTVGRRIEDAAATLASSGDASWDMIFLDAERPFYTDYWPDLVRVLVPGGLLAVDNVVSHAEQVREFRELVAADDRVIDSLVPTGSGVLVIMKKRA